MAQVGIGGQNGTPFIVGGGESTFGTIQESIKEELADVFNSDDSSIADSYAYAESLMVAMIWDINERTKNQAVALKAIENIEYLEQIYNIKPTARQTDVERRRVLDARQKILGNVGAAALQNICSAFLGQHFVGVYRVDDDEVVRYWSPINPGPAGFEWYSNKLFYQIQVTKNGVDDTLFLDRMAQFDDLMNAILPTWADYTWHTGEGFIVGQSLFGEAAYS